MANLKPLLSEFTDLRDNVFVWWSMFAIYLLCQGCTSFCYCRPHYFCLCEV